MEVLALITKSAHPHASISLPKTETYDSVSEAVLYSAKAALNFICRPVKKTAFTILSAQPEE